MGFSVCGPFCHLLPRNLRNWLKVQILELDCLGMGRRDPSLCQAPQARFESSALRRSFPVLFCGCFSQGGRMPQKAFWSLERGIWLTAALFCWVRSQALAKSKMRKDREKRVQKQTQQHRGTWLALLSVNFVADGKPKVWASLYLGVLQSGQGGRTSKPGVY